MSEKVFFLLIFISLILAAPFILAEHGKRVFEKLASQDKQLYLIPEAGHNDLFDHGREAFAETLFSFVERQMSLAAKEAND